MDYFTNLPGKSEIICFLSSSRLKQPYNPHIREQRSPI
jgi:hypothetical protein